MHDLTGKKIAKSNKNVEYVNFMLQTERENFHAVSYKKGTWEQLRNAFVEKSPIKLTNVEFVQNKFNINQLDVRTTRDTTVQNTQVSFPYTTVTSTWVKPPADCVSLKEIETAKKPKDLVTVKVHIDVENRPVVLTSSRYHSDPVKKK